MGIRPEHFLLLAFILGCYYAHQKSRQFILDFLPFAYFGILYDFLRIIPKNWAGTIHVVWPYLLEKELFGFQYSGQKIIPCEFFTSHHHLILDILAAFSYSLHMVLPIGFAFYAWLKNQPLARRFIWTFFVANLFAFFTYIFLPVAPPWYVDQYGLSSPAGWSVISSAAGLIHFDRLIGIPYFQKIYSENAWVFGAIPSMHAGFPLLVLLFAHKIFRIWLIPLYLFMFSVWFSAVYLNHHYIIDLIAGVLYALAAYLLTRIFPRNNS